MNTPIVRISSLKIVNIKNTNYGLIELPLQTGINRFQNLAETLGIYGQNGSGKTAVIDSLFYIQKIIMGQSLPAELVHFINKDKDFAELTLELTIEENEKKYKVGYQVKLQKTRENKVIIAKESLNASRISEKKNSNKLPFIKYTCDEGTAVFTPKKRFDEVAAGNKENRMDLIVAKKVAGINYCSYIFGDPSRKILCEKSGQRFSDYAWIIQSVYQYACMGLFVIRNAHSGAISADFLLPMAFRTGNKSGAEKGDFVITLNEPTLIREDKFDLLKKVITEVNIVLQAIIQGLTIGILDYGQQLIQNGMFGNKIELVSNRDGIQIPIRMESDGIIKIISILNVLVRSYNDPSVCLAIDELDAGIYEYLLGEILDIYDKGAKGQLIFTSHNLRALEMLNKNSILFSTANPNNRYIRMQNIRNSYNLRDHYIRSITLGGQKETIYSETDSIRIARAFRKAGKDINDADDRKKGNYFYC